MRMVAQSHQWLLSKRQCLPVSWSSHANIKLPLRSCVCRGLRYPNYCYFSRGLFYDLETCTEIFSIQYFYLRIFKNLVDHWSLYRKWSTEPWMNWRRNLTWRSCMNCSVTSTRRSTPIWDSFMKKALKMVIGFNIAPWEHSRFLLATNIC